jgi:hypothetical protein
VPPSGSPGLPIGLGVYLAWTNRAFSAVTRTAGFVAALAGALAGAWLGFGVTEDLIRLYTSILGAAAGANLLLLALDIASARQARARVAPAAAKETVDARP